MLNVYLLRSLLFVCCVWGIQGRLMAASAASEVNAEDEGWEIVVIGEKDTRWLEQRLEELRQQRATFGISDYFSAQRKAVDLRIDQIETELKKREDAQTRKMAEAEEQRRQMEEQKRQVAEQAEKDAQAVKRRELLASAYGYYGLALDEAITPEIWATVEAKHKKFSPQQQLSAAAKYALLWGDYNDPLSSADRATMVKEEAARQQQRVAALKAKTEAEEAQKREDEARRKKAEQEALEREREERARVDREFAAEQARQRADQERREREVKEALLAALKKRDEACKLLGLTWETIVADAAFEKTITKACTKKVAQRHPDRVGAEEKKAAEADCANFGQAKDLLIEEIKRLQQEKAANS